MSEVLWTRRAKSDLDEIWDYLADSNQDTADRLVERISHRLETYARRPTTGGLATNIYSSLPAELRCFVEQDYVIFYLPCEDAILVSRVLHGRRNIPQIFRDELLDDNDDEEVN